LDIDTVIPVEAVSDLVIQTLIDRIQRSTTFEQFIYRENELDELWRLLDIALRAGEPIGSRKTPELERLRDAVHRAHDLVGMDGKPAEAAATLRAVLA
jgi:hypothetical protein